MMFPKKVRDLLYLRLETVLIQIVLVRAFGNDLEVIARSGSIIIDANGIIQVN